MFFFPLLTNTSHTLSLSQSSLHWPKGGFSQERMGHGGKIRSSGWLWRFRLNQRCWLHLSPGLYFGNSFCVYVIPNDEVIDQVTSSTLTKALRFKVEIIINYMNISYENKRYKLLYALIGAATSRNFCRHNTNNWNAVAMFCQYYLLLSNIHDIIIASLSYARTAHCLSLAAST